MDKILILTEDGAGSGLLRSMLQDEGFLLFFASVGRESALCHLRELDTDAVVVDLVEGSGRAAEIYARLREGIGIKPTVALGNSGKEADKVMALEAGFDDYVVKPFAARELIARLHAVLRRRTSNRAAIVGFDGIEVDRINRTVKRNGRIIEMTRCEYALLSFFLNNTDLALKRETLLAAVWGYSDSSRSRTLDTHVNRLRRKCEQSPANPGRIVTIYGFGYRFCGPLVTDGTYSGSPGSHPSKASHPSTVMNATERQGAAMSAAE